MNTLALLVFFTAFIPTVELPAQPFPEFTVAYSNNGIIYETNFKEGPTQLTDNTSYNISPTWSPNGQQLAFLSDTSDSPKGQYHVAVMNVATRDIKEIDSLELTSEASLAWSPDGTHIAVTFGALYVVNVETEQIRQLSVDNISAQHSSWSTDSMRIVFSASSDIYVIFADGHDIQKISANPYSASSDQPLWSPNNNQILFRSLYDNTLHLKIVDLDTRSTTDIMTTQGNDVLNLEWSSDGEQIAFTVYGDTNAGTPVIDSGDVYIMNADGSNLRRITGKGTDYLVGWTPDNQHVVYQSQELGGAAVSLQVVNTANGKTTNLTNDRLKDMCVTLNCQSMSIRPQAND